MSYYRTKWEQENKGPGPVEAMVGRCDWYFSIEKHLCAFPHCENEARYACLTHEYEGFVCTEHRSWHQGQWILLEGGGSHGKAGSRRQESWARAE